jgi:hypothetical protein
MQNKKIIRYVFLSFLLIDFSAEAIVIPGPYSQPSNQQQQLQLQAQELQLEQKILEIKQRLLFLQQQAALQNQTAQQNSNLNWVDAHPEKIPAHAVIGAYANDKPLYICHAEYLLQGTHPGQVNSKGCLITYGGKAMVMPHYQVLIASQAVQWKSSEALQFYLRRAVIPYYPVYYSGSAPLANMSNSIGGVPVQGGYEPNHPIYICRAMYGDTIHLGKTFGIDGQPVCNIGVDGSEIHVPTFEVLFTE